MALDAKGRSDEEDDEEYPPEESEAPDDGSEGTETDVTSLTPGVAGADKRQEADFGSEDTLESLEAAFAGLGFSSTNQTESSRSAQTTTPDENLGRRYVDPAAVLFGEVQPQKDASSGRTPARPSHHPIRGSTTGEGRGKGRKSSGLNAPDPETERRAVEIMTRYQ